MNAGNMWEGEQRGAGFIGSAYAACVPAPQLYMRLRRNSPHAPLTACVNKSLLPMPVSVLASAQNAFSPSTISCSSLASLRLLAMPVHSHQFPVHPCMPCCPLLPFSEAHTPRMSMLAISLSPCLSLLAMLAHPRQYPVYLCHAWPFPLCSEAHTSRMSAGDADESPQYAQHHLSHSISFPASVSARLISYIRLSFRACPAVFA